VTAVDTIEHGVVREPDPGRQAEAGERVLVVVDEPLIEEGSELARGVKDAGGEPRTRAVDGEKRPMAAAPRACSEAWSRRPNSRSSSRSPRAVTRPMPASS
jgi:hypothetical protein